MAQKQANNLLNPRRFAGALIAILLVSVVGVYFLQGSDASTPTYHQILNYQARSQTAGVTDIQAQINSLGPQTVSSVAPGAQLDYQTGGKVAYKSHCYYYSVLPNKGGGQTAKIQFVGQGSAVTVNVTYSPENQGFLKRTCVGSGKQALKGYNVANLSPTDGPNVLVFQDIISF